MDFFLSVNSTILCYLLKKIAKILVSLNLKKKKKKTLGCLQCWEVLPAQGKD
jgi:hypothetical protein